MDSHEDQHANALATMAARRVTAQRGLVPLQQRTCCNTPCCDAMRQAELAVVRYLAKCPPLGAGKCATARCHSFASQLVLSAVRPHTVAHRYSAGLAAYFCRLRDESLSKSESTAILFQSRPSPFRVSLPSVKILSASQPLIAGSVVVQLTSLHLAHCGNGLRRKVLP